MGVSDLGINSSLLVAASDLNLVRLLVGAMRTADQGSPAGRSSGSTPVEAAVRTVTRTITVGNRDHPAASFEPRSLPRWHRRLDESEPCCSERPVVPVDRQPSIQPPWKVLPWPRTCGTYSAHGHRKIKVQPNVTDLSPVGRTLDLFV